MARRQISFDDASQKVSDAVESRATFLDTYLVAFQAHHRIQNRTQLPKFAISTTVESQASQERSEESEAFKSKLIVHMSLSVVTKYKADDAEPAMAVSATYKVIYGIGPGKKLTHRQIMSFSALSTLPMIWPYFREFVHSSSSRMGLPVLRLPIFQRGQVKVEPSEA